jgi:formate hydrogenlyase subunit 6/NADH:ubiquinone oxidoreductase subunit I
MCIRDRYKISDISENLRNVPEPPWLDESYNCIGCGACTGICPTCYCLILNDESENGSFKKVKSYDSCQFNGYAKVAGGGTPRPNMVQRFRNRYLCKLDFMKSNFGKFGCIGCGRCSEACSAQIDFMEVVANNSKIAESL